MPPRNSCPAPTPSTRATPGASCVTRPTPSIPCSSPPPDGQLSAPPPSSPPDSHRAVTNAETLARTLVDGGIRYALLPRNTAPVRWRFLGETRESLFGLHPSAGVPSRPGNGQTLLLVKSRQHLLEQIGAFYRRQVDPQARVAPDRPKTTRAFPWSVRRTRRRPAATRCPWARTILRPPLPAWRVQLFSPDSELIDGIAREQITFYWWSVIAMIAGDHRRGRHGGLGAQPAHLPARTQQRRAGRRLARDENAAGLHPPADRDPPGAPLPGRRGRRRRIPPAHRRRKRAARPHGRGVPGPFPGWSVRATAVRAWRWISCGWRKSSNSRGNACDHGWKRPAAIFAWRSTPACRPFRADRGCARRRAGQPARQRAEVFGRRETYRPARREPARKKWCSRSATGARGLIPKNRPGFSSGFINPTVACRGCTKAAAWG